MKASIFVRAHYAHKWLLFFSSPAPFWHFGDAPVRRSRRGGVGIDIWFLHPSSATASTNIAGCRYRCHLKLILLVTSVGYVYLRWECCVHTNAAFNMTEYSTINHVNDSDRQLDGFGCRSQCKMALWEKGPFPFCLTWSQVHNPGSWAMWRKTKLKHENRQKWIKSH